MTGPLNLHERKCANPGCDQPRSSKRLNGCCSIACAEIVLAERGKWPKCANPDCDKPARSRKKISCCSNKCTSHMANLRKYERTKKELHKCGNPECENMCTAIACSKPCYRKVLRAEMKAKKLVLLGVCANTGCGKPARTNRINSTCSEKCAHELDNRRRVVQMKEQRAQKPVIEKIARKCANPGCDNKPRSSSPYSCCSDECLEIMRREKSDYKSKIINLAKSRGIKQSDYGRDVAELEDNMRNAGNFAEMYKRDPIIGSTDRAFLRADALIEASKQPGYDRHNSAVIKRRVDAILISWIEAM